jgi:hypothetical protein
MVQGAGAEVCDLYGQRASQRAHKEPMRHYAERSGIEPGAGWCPRENGAKQD